MSDSIFGFFVIELASFRNRLQSKWILAFLVFGWYFKGVDQVYDRNDHTLHSMIAGCYYIWFIL